MTDGCKEDKYKLNELPLIYVVHSGEVEETIDLSIAHTSLFVL